MALGEELRDALCDTDGDCVGVGVVVRLAEADGLGVEDTLGVNDVDGDAVPLGVPLTLVV